MTGFERSKPVSPPTSRGHVPKIVPREQPPRAAHLRISSSPKPAATPSAPASARKAYYLRLAQKSAAARKARKARKAWCGVTDAAYGAAR